MKEEEERRMTVAELERKFQAAMTELYDIEQLLAEALGYPRYCDDLESFPEADESDGFCTGEMTVFGLAEQMVKAHTLLTEQNTSFLLQAMEKGTRLSEATQLFEQEKKDKIFIPAELRGCLLSTVQKSKDFLADLIRRIEQNFPDNERRIHAIQSEIDGWKIEIAEYDEVLKALTGESSSEETLSQ